MPWPTGIPGCPYVLAPDPLGAGGYAVVLKGKHVVSGRDAAVKTHRPLRNARDKKPRARLRREIRAMLAMSHPNVMPVLEAAPDLSWYVMPLAAGSLFKMGKRTGSALVECLRQVALAMSYAHGLGMIHRDLTPANILWIPGLGLGRWVVADWGLVLPPNLSDQIPLTTNGVPIGTPGFRAPELHDGQGDARSDIYSLGRIAAWSLTGILPSSLDPVVVSDPLWKTLIDKMTSLTPSARTQTMYEVLLTFGDIAEALSSAEHCWRCRSVVLNGGACPVCGCFALD